MEVQILTKQGLGIKEIVRRTGLARNTVRKYVRRRPQYAARAAKPTKLSPFADFGNKGVKIQLPLTPIFESFECV